MVLRGIYLILFLLLASCESAKKQTSSWLNYSLTPSQGIVIYDKEIHKGLSAKGGKTLGRHMEAAYTSIKFKMINIDNNNIRSFWKTKVRIYRIILYS